MSTPAPFHSAPSVRTRGWFDLRVLLVPFGVFFAWTEITQVWHGWGRPGTIFSYTAFIPLQLASGAALVRAARRADLPRRTARGLRLLALNFFALAVGSALLAAYTVAAGNEPPITLADFFYIASYPLTAAALLLLPRRREGTMRWSRQLLD